MINKKIRYTITFWPAALLSVVLLTLFISFCKRLNYKQTTGEVVSINTDYVPSRPQIRYVVDGEEYFFVDNSFRPTKEQHPIVFYKPGKPGDAIAYTMYFWFDLNYIIPFCFLALGVYSLGIIQLTNYGNKPVILFGWDGGKWQRR